MHLSTRPVTRNTARILMFLPVFVWLFLFVRTEVKAFFCSEDHIAPKNSEGGQMASKKPIHTLFFSSFSRTKNKTRCFGPDVNDAYLSRLKANCISNEGGFVFVGFRRRPKK